MKLWMKALAVGTVAAAAGILLGIGIGSDRLENLPELPENVLTIRPAINIWYTDEALGDYLASAALDFSEKRDVRVIPKLVSGLEYLENINQESLHTKTCPDLYIIGNESLEKAWLAGLASDIRDEEDFVSEAYFPGPAIQAVTCQGHVIGYPYYYETSALIYNKTYMEEAARGALEVEADARAGEEAMQALEEGGVPSEEEGGTPPESQEMTFDEEEVAWRMTELIPSSVEDIRSFADNYNAPEQVEAVFKWDVSDIFYNYFFVGNYIDVGGPDGDDADRIDIYNMDAIRCLLSWQNLNQFFSIEADAVDYDTVVQEFADGKLVFTVATTDILSRLEEAAGDGRFPYEYGVTLVPDIEEGLETKSLSVTNAIVVNGYSDKKDLANEFAHYLTGEASSGLFAGTGKLPALKDAPLPMEQAEAFRAEYADSVPIPKMVETSNYWVQLEIAFTRIWSGAEVSETLKELSEQIKTQVTGTAVTEDYIPLPEEETLPAEDVEIMEEDEMANEGEGEEQQ